MSEAERIITKEEAEKFDTSRMGAAELLIANKLHEWPDDRMATMLRVAMKGLVDIGKDDDGWCRLCMFQCPDAGCVHGDRCIVGDTLVEIERIASE